MNILVVNDDGIGAKGIQTLVEYLSKEGDVYVAAPNTQKSATGHGITVGRPVIVNEVTYENAVLGLEVHGSPADCVKVGLQILEEKGIDIDIVYAGINHGANLGTDTLYSGTASAAIEGSMCGKPAVAISLDNHHAVDTDFTYCGEVAVKVLKDFLPKVPVGVALNVNIPNIKREDINGLTLAKLGIREYENIYQTDTLDDHSYKAKYSGVPVRYDSEDLSIDVVASQRGYVTVTPLQYDFTNYKMLEEMKKWKLEEK